MPIAKWSKWAVDMDHTTRALWVRILVQAADHSCSSGLTLSSTNLKPNRSSSRMSNASHMALGKCSWCNLMCMLSGRYWASEVSGCHLPNLRGRNGFEDSQDLRAGGCYILPSVSVTISSLSLYDKARLGVSGGKYPCARHGGLRPAGL